MDGPDLENRDPNNLNDHVKVLFDDVFGEPEGAHSADCVWKLSYTCFTGGKKICYMILTFICAAPLALCWGCEFACVTFAHIWQVTPCLRMWQINIGCCRNFFASCVDCYYGTLCESFALFFSKIKVTNS